MFKFLRKYNKWILAVGGTLLMIVFLVPQAIQALSQSAAAGSATIATYGAKGEHSVRAADWNRAQQEVQFLQTVGRQVIANAVEISDPEHWYLLVEEARAADLIGGRQLAYDLIPDSPTLTRDQQLQLMAQRAGGDRDFTLDTIAKTLGVAQLIKMTRDGAPFSDLRLRHTAARIFHQVGGEMIIIEADPADSTIQPTEDQILTQMNAYADVLPGEGEHGFGYRLPDRAKLEWVSIPAAAARTVVAASADFDGVAQKKYWRLNESRFGAADFSKPVPQSVKDALLDELTEAKLAEIAKFAQDSLMLKRRGLATREGYFVLPDDWNEDLPALARELQERYGVELPPYKSSGAKWLTMTDLGSLAGIGLASTTQFGSTPIGLAQLVSATKEFRGSQTITIQQGITGATLTGPDGSRYLFRITATDPNRPPTGVDEVRDAVVNDLRRLDAYSSLINQVDAMRADAIEMGMLAMAIDRGTSVRRVGGAALANPQQLSIQLQLGRTLTPAPTSLPVLGPNTEVIAALVDHGLALPLTTPANEIPVADRLVVMPVEAQLAALVFKITRQVPLTQEQYEAFAAAGIIQEVLNTGELDDDAVIRDVFSRDAIVARHNFKFNRRDTNDPDADPPTTSAGLGG
ncbi:MAG: hypothetical protein KDA25_03505 [Phycisphaerales bacterium]|nr:hypothetical protein [Phycisphaerales bacterium]